MFQTANFQEQQLQSFLQEDLRLYLAMLVIQDLSLLIRMVIRNNCQEIINLIVRMR